MQTRCHFHFITAEDEIRRARVSSEVFLQARIVSDRPSLRNCYEVNYGVHALFATIELLSFLLWQVFRRHLQLLK